MGWLKTITWLSVLLGPKGIKGFFTEEIDTVWKLDNVGEAAFLFSCFGISSLSRIREVLSSSFPVLWGGDETSLCNFGLERQAGEDIFGISNTTSCSHSSVIFAPSLPSAKMLSSMFSSITSTLLACTDKSSTTGSCRAVFDAVTSSLALAGIALRQPNY